MHQSIATIDAPEFINLQPLEINPLMSSCEIKVLYIGENRNRSYITKEVASEMAKTLRGAPIVGYFKKDKGDFGDHGEQMVIDGDGVRFNCLTQPYGFVSPDAEVWFQKFEEQDDFGNTIIREYLMTTGYLWTEQFEEAKTALEGSGCPHSMELDEKTLTGHWAENSNSGIEFFIINDAIFSKLCILGEDVEPCFEGSTITTPNVSKNFALDDKFKRTLFSMMQDLTFALEGGLEKMVKSKDNLDESIVNKIDNSIEAQESENSAEVEFKKKDDEEEKDAPANEENASEDTDSKADSEESEDDEDKKKKVAKNSLTEYEDGGEASGDAATEAGDADASESESEESTEESAGSEDNNETEDSETEDAPSDPEIPSEEENEDITDAVEKTEDEILAETSIKKKEYSLEEYEELQAKFSALEESYNELLAFKEGIINERKDSLIESFYMLSDEDKKEVIENKAKYSLEDIEAKLSVICVRKKVNFSLDEEETDNSSDVITTFNVDAEENVPAWIKAVMNHKED
ncbi:MAG: hypothetical protein KBT06_04520 [Prevotellaceae bacterium]|nr:hypothetical protein [Candidatus Colivivens equi]